MSDIDINNKNNAVMSVSLDNLYCYGRRRGDTAKLNKKVYAKTWGGGGEGDTMKQKAVTQFRAKQKEALPLTKELTWWRGRDTMIS